MFLHTNELQDLGKSPCVFGKGKTRAWRVWSEGQIIGSIMRVYPSKAVYPYRATFNFTIPVEYNNYKTLKEAEAIIRERVKPRKGNIKCVEVY